MTVPPTVSPDVAETIREDHLRLAVLLDQIQDDMAAAQPVGPRLAQLRMEFERHANREEEVLARVQPETLESHRRGHDRMRILLHNVTARYDGGHDIGELLDQVVGMFTGQLMPADGVFITLAPPSATAG